MESLLTPVVNRLLRRFVKSADQDGQEMPASSLRATFTYGSLVLRNLELNLDPILQGLPVRVRRAFARELRIEIPWASLGYQPVELRLDTVECIFADSTDVTDGAQESAHGDPVGPHSPDGTGASEGAESDGSGGGGWAQIFLQQAIGNIRVVVNNLVVKYVGPQAQASFTCRHICVFSAEDNWQSRLVEPENWVKLCCEVSRATVCLDEGSPDGVGHPSVFQEPLFRCASLGVSVLAPVSVLLNQGRHELADQLQISVEASSEPIVAAINSLQVVWLHRCLESLPKAFARKDQQQYKASQHHVRKRPQGNLKASPAARLDCVGGEGEQQGQDEKATLQGANPARVGGAMSWLKAGAGYALGSAWEYMTDEATASANAAESATRQPANRPPPPLELVVSVTLKGFAMSCRRVNYESYKRVQTYLCNSSGQRRVDPEATNRALGDVVHRGIQSVLAEEPLQPITPGAAVGAKYRLPPELEKQASGNSVDGRGPAEVEEFLEPPFLAISLQDVGARIHTGAQDLLLDLSLGLLSVKRPVGVCLPKGGIEGADAGDAASAPGKDGAVEDELLGLYPQPGTPLGSPQDAHFRSAMRVKWRKTAYTPADAEEEACQTPPASHSVSAAMGVVGVAYAPGVIASCFRFLEPQEVPGGGGGHGGMSNDDTEDPARAPGVQTAGAAGGGLGLKEALVNKRLDAAFSLGFLHLAVLSTSEIDAEAIVLAARCLTVAAGKKAATATLEGLDPFAHLFSRRQPRTSSSGSSSKATFHELSASGGSVEDVVGSLHEEAAAALNAAVVRLAVEAATWGIACGWIPKRTRAEGVLAKGVEAVSCQLQVESEWRLRPDSSHWQGGSIDGRDDFPALSWCYNFRFGPGWMAFTSQQLAALLATVYALLAEMGLGYREPMPRRIVHGVEEGGSASGDSALSSMELRFPKGILVAVGGGWPDTDMPLFSDRGKQPCWLMAIDEAKLHTRFSRSAAAAGCPAVGQPSRPALKADSQLLVVRVSHFCLWQLWGGGMGVRSPLLDISTATGENISSSETLATLTQVEYRSGGACLSHSTTGTPSPIDDDDGWVRRQLAFHSFISAISQEQLAGLALIHIAVCSAQSYVPQLPSYPAPPQDLKETSRQVALPSCFEFDIDSMDLRVDAPPGEDGDGKGQLNVSCKGVSYSSVLQPRSRGMVRQPPAESRLTVVLGDAEVAWEQQGVGKLRMLCRDQGRSAPGEGGAQAEPLFRMALAKGMGAAPRAQQGHQQVGAEVVPLKAAISCAAVRGLSAFASQLSSISARALAAKGANLSLRREGINTERHDVHTDLPHITGKVFLRGLSVDADADGCTAWLGFSDIICMLRDPEESAEALTASALGLAAPGGFHFDIVTMGLQAGLAGKGLPPSGVNVLHPCDLRLEISRSSVAGTPGLTTTRVHLHSAAVSLQTSPGAFCCISALSKGLANALAAGKADGGCIPGPFGCAAYPEDLEDPGGRRPLDDLRSGVFSLSEGSRPEPLQIATHTSRDGLQHSIGWYFASARPVSSVLFKRLRALAAPTCSLKLLQASPGSGKSFCEVPFEARLDRENDGLLLVVLPAEAPPSSQEWRVTWTVQSLADASFSVSRVLRALHVNPSRSGTGRGGPPPLHVPALVGLHVGHVRLGIFVERSSLKGGPEWQQTDVGALYVEDFMAKFQAWPEREAFASRMGGAISLFYVDATSLMEQALLERTGGVVSLTALPPPPESASMNHRGTRRYTPRPQHSKSLAEATSMLGPVETTLDPTALMQALPFPEQPGLAVAARCGGASMRISKQAMNDVSRAAELVSTRSRASVVSAAPKQQHEDGPAAAPAADGVCASRTSPDNGMLQDGVLLENLCPVALKVSQAGAAPGTAVELSAGARQLFCWPEIPECRQGVSRQLVVSVSTGKGQPELQSGRGSLAPWSLRPGSAHHRRVVCGGGALVASVSIRVVRRAGGQLACELRPGHRISNRTASDLAVLYHGILPSQATRSAPGEGLVGKMQLRLAAGASADVMMLEPAEGSNEIGKTHPTGASGASAATLQVAKDFHPSMPSPKIEVWSALIEAGRPTEVRIPNGPMGADSAVMWQAGALPDDKSGQVEFCLWPQVTFYNGLPAQVDVGIVNLANQAWKVHSVVSVAPGFRAPLDVLVYPMVGVVVRLANAGHSQQGEETQAAWSAPLSLGSQGGAVQPKSLNQDGSDSLFSAPDQRGAPYPNLVLGRQATVQLFPCTEPGKGTPPRTPPQPVACSILASRDQKEPCIRLGLWPVAVCRNSLPCAVEILTAPPSSPSCSVLARAGRGTSTPFDWGKAPQGRIPSHLHLRILQDGDEERESLNSISIDAKDGTFRLLPIWHRGGKGNGDRCQLLAVCVELVPKPEEPDKNGSPGCEAGNIRGVSDSDESAATSASQAADSVMEVTVAPGLVVTNLTRWLVNLRGSCVPSAQTAPAVASVSHGGTTVVMPQTTQSCGALWSEDVESESLHKHGEQASWPGPPESLGVEFRLIPRDGSSSSTPGAPLEGGHRIPASPLWSCAIPLLGGDRRRRRCPVESPDGGRALVTWRITVTSKGQVHLVLFQDLQPPAVLTNLTCCDLEVGMATASAQGLLGGVVYGLPDAEEVVFVGAGSELEWEPPAREVIQPWTGASNLPSITGVDTMGEDEDMLLDVLMRIASEQPQPLDTSSSTPLPLLRVRTAGSKTWQEEDMCFLREGMYDMGSCISVSVAKVAATWHICIERRASTLSPPRVSSCGTWPLCVAVACENLHVSLCEDQGALPDAPGETHGARTADEFAILSVGGCMAAVGVKEAPVACPRLSAGSLATDHMVPVRCWTVHLGFDILQVDSLLPGVSYPVVVSSLPDYRRPDATTPALSPAMLLSMTACQAPCCWDEGGGHDPLMGTWVQRLYLRLPRLVAAVDDSSILLVERLQGLGTLASTTPSPPGVDRGDGPTTMEKLTEEARGLASCRLLVEDLEIAPVSLLADVHLGGATSLPVVLDTRGSPVQLSPIRLSGAMYRPSVLARGLSAHLMAEAMLSAPMMVGSLELLFNPTGLLSSVLAGVRDFVALPLAGLESRTASGFLLGVGAGGASLLAHLSGWTLTSISGFSSAFARVLVLAVSTNRHRPPGRPASLAGGLASGAGALAGGLMGGLAGIIREPLEGYARGGSTGAIGGVGRGLLGAVGLPISGALEALGAVSAGLAGTVGVGDDPSTWGTTPAWVRPPSRARGEPPRPTSTRAMHRLRLAQGFHLAREANYVGHCLPRRVALADPARAGETEQHTAVPVLLLCDSVLAVLPDACSYVALVTPLDQSVCYVEDFGVRSVTIYCRDSTTQPAGGAAPRSYTVEAHLDSLDWGAWMPLLRSRVKKCSCGKAAKRLSN